MSNLTNVGSRKEQKEATRRRLIETASQLFADRGIAGTATADVAKLLKVSHGTVFLHFPTRDDLVLAVIDRFGAELASEFDRALSKEMSLEQILRAHLKVLARFEEFYYRLVTEIPHLPEKVRGTAFLINASVSWYMFEASKELMRQGELRTVERHLFFNTWMALVQYYVVHRDLFSEKKPILADKGEMLLKHFLSLMRGSDEKQKRRSKRR